MKILLVAATTDELSGLFKHFNLPNQDFTSTPSFDVLITGVGMTATAFSLGRHLKEDYELVLNLGIAGSFDPTIPLSSLVNVTEDHFSELGAEDHNAFLDIEKLGLGKNHFHSSDMNHIPQINELKKVSGITVNTVHGNHSSIAEIKHSLSPDIESMEGAAVFYCCELLELPVVQIRSISNYVEPRNKQNWQLAPAVKNLNDWAIRFLTNT